jgi:hypothetical protein
MRVRGRAMATTLLALAALVALVGMIPFPDRCRVEGVVEPDRMAIVHAGADGFVDGFLASGRRVSPDGAPLLWAHSRELEAERTQLVEERRSILARRSLAQAKNEQAMVQALDKQVSALDDQIGRAEEELAALTVRATFVGEWISPDIERLRSSYLRRGDRIGLLASLDRLVIRATAGQNVVALLITDASPNVEIRVKGEPALATTGTIRRILPAGQDRPPSAAMAREAGGAMEVEQDDRGSVRAAERFFEIEIDPAASDHFRLMAGERVVVRFDLSRQPLTGQFWRWLLQLVQKRFHI